ncbi:hypothetical protein [Photobacterium angustum]|uniref:hypothetical protein n=1 Tax=Photobacterium angustum TaxID=661 RepID=UPI0005E63952|nr:hypothetical protein [Photobacterium angustum]KJF93243.1 hypothetical protein UB39_16065 [Photobacterium angustum]PSW81087.1 hypothetical protein CTN03_08230 [Photobacterium angustum]
MASIQSLSSAVLDNAKKYSKYESLLHLVTFICAASSIFLTGNWLYIIALVAMLSELSAWLLSKATNNKKSLGQELIRLNIIQKSYGSDMSVDLAYLKSRVTSDEFKKADKFENSNYYATDESSPKVRLVDIIQESCFWSQHLYQACKQRAVRNSILLAVLILALIVTGLSVTSSDANFSIPRLALLFLMSFPLWNYIDEAISFGCATSKLTSIDQRLGTSKLSVPNLLSLFSEYNVVTSNTPLIPQKVFESEQGQLNKLWDERKKHIAPIIFFLENR